MESFRDSKDIILKFKFIICTPLNGEIQSECWMKVWYGKAEDEGAPNGWGGEF